MSAILNGEPIVERKTKPRNYQDQVELSRELKKDILHTLWNLTKDKEYDKWDEERRAKLKPDDFFLTDFGRADTRFGR